MGVGLAIVLVAIIGFAIYSRGLRRAVLIALAVVVSGVAFLFYNSPTSDYRACVALMWDRKHPDAVKKREEEAEFNKCEADRLQKGLNCDCKARKGQSGYCDVASDYFPHLSCRLIFPPSS